MKAVLALLVLGSVSPVPVGEYVCAGAHATIQCMADRGGHLSLRVHTVFIDDSRQYVVVGCGR